MGDVIVIAVIAVICFFVIRSMVKNRKKGGSCSCGCDGCGMKDHCHTAKNKTENK